MADVCKIDRQMATKEDHINLANSTGVIWRAGQAKGLTDEEIIESIRYVGGWFVRCDWRGKKGESPTPELMRKVWRQAIDARPARTTPTPAPTRIDAPPGVQPVGATAGALLRGREQLQRSKERTA